MPRSQDTCPCCSQSQAGSISEGQRPSTNSDGLRKAHSAGHSQNTLVFFMNIPAKSDDRQSFGTKCDPTFAYNRDAD